MSRNRTVLVGLAVTVVAAALLPGAASAAGGRTSAAAVDGPTLTETTRLAERRALVTGDRLYEMGTEDGLYPASGFHTRGEMGGFWSPPVKLLDGMWFRVGGQWLGQGAAASAFTAGHGWTRTSYAPVAGVTVQRTDVVPDGLRAGLVGLTLTSSTDTTVPLAMDAHSELMNVYPWGETVPSQTAYNLQDTGSVTDGALVFREQGTPQVANAEAHDYAAVVGSSLTPSGSALGPDHRGPQDPAVICPASGPNAPEQPARCDDTAYGKGTGGQLTYSVPVSAGTPRTVWFAVGGSDKGLTPARAAYQQALADPAGLLARKQAARAAVAARSTVDLPGDRLLQQSVEWSKQNLADSVQEAHDLRLRPVSAGKAYPAPAGTLDSVRFIGAGWPDYPWLFGTDGEYTAFGAVAGGLFEPIQAHLRSLRDVSEVVNQHSGKVVHEVVTDGSVYFGANSDPGNTDETAKFPSAVALVWRWTGDNAFRDDLYDFAVRNMRYVVTRLDADGDGWPEGLGNVERNGMGVEKLDNTVYTIRGLRDLADMAQSRGDGAVAGWATSRATKMEQAFEQQWWYGGDAKQYADSIDLTTDPSNDNTKIFQRHWIGLTPMDALLRKPGTAPAAPLASADHGQTALEQRQKDCYSGELGLFHTGTGPTSDPAGNKGPTCDSVVSSVQSERVVFSLNTAIMAVAQGNYGRMAADEQRRYTTANSRIQLDRSVWEQPGASPEIAPSPDFGANIDRKFTERSSVLQAWGSYGILWPVVAQQLGVSPDLGRGRLDVVPQVPDGQPSVAGKDIRLGSGSGAGSVDVTAARSGSTLTTTVVRRLDAALRIGAVLPSGAQVASVTLDGQPVSDYRVVKDQRGTQVLVDAGSARGTDTLVVTVR